MNPRLRLVPGWSTETGAAALALALFVFGGCSSSPDEAGDRLAVPGRPGAFKTVAEGRAERRAFDGAPPVIPHLDFGSRCGSCHGSEGVAVAGAGFAPRSPHDLTPGLGSTAHCRQCHVEQISVTPWVGSTFEGLHPELTPGNRLYRDAPPVLPHPVFMRESCLACHGGPAAREEIRTSHPERLRCLQCHLEARTAATFENPS